MAPNGLAARYVFFHAARLAAGVVLVCGTGCAVTAHPKWAYTGADPLRIDPPDRQQIESGIRRGVDFLVGAQKPDGSWGAGTGFYGIVAELPGSFRTMKAATSSLCLSALLESGIDDPEVIEAIDRSEAWMFANLGSLRRDSPGVLYSMWAHPYAIKVLVRMRERYPDDEDRIAEIDRLIRYQVERVCRLSSVDGGWGYYDTRGGTMKPGSLSFSFATATVLEGLKEADSVGISPPRDVVDRAIEALRRLRKPDHSYVYIEPARQWPMRPLQRPQASLGRSLAACDALLGWEQEDVTDEIAEAWLMRLCVYNNWLDVARKRTRPHESYYAISGYFVLYTYYHAALCIEEIPPEKRSYYRGYLASFLLETQEKDGSWWDFPLYDYHQGYGTGYGLMALIRCREELPDGKRGRAN